MLNEDINFILDEINNNKKTLGSLTAKFYI